jgi:adenine-specific DNA methylase
MKTRILSIAGIVAAGALLAACTATFRNSDACEQLMRSKLADTSPDTLRVAHRGAAIRGSRVVIEGSIEHVTTASEAAAAAASSAQVAAAAHAASAVQAASGAGGVSAASEATATSVASASAPEAAPTVKAASAKSAKPKTVSTAAAAECTFNGSELNVFRWLAPARLATPVDNAASAAAG